MGPVLTPVVSVRTEPDWRSPSWCQNWLLVWKKSHMTMAWRECHILCPLVVNNDLRSGKRKGKVLRAILPNPGKEP